MAVIVEDDIISKSEQQEIYDILLNENSGITYKFLGNTAVKLNGLSSAVVYTGEDTFQFSTRIPPDTYQNPIIMKIFKPFFDFCIIFFC